MRRDDGVLQIVQRTVRGQRLLLKDIERGAGNPSLAERAHQRRLLHDRPAADVDEQCRRLHHAELPFAQQPASALCQGQSHHHDVGLAQHVGQSLRPQHRFDSRDRRRCAPRADHAQVEDLCLAGNLPADGPQTQDAERLAGDLTPERGAAIPPPLQLLAQSDV